MVPYITGFEIDEHFYCQYKSQRFATISEEKRVEQWFPVIREIIIERFHLFKEWIKQPDTKYTKTFIIHKKDDRCPYYIGLKPGYYNPNSCCKVTVLLDEAKYGTCML